MSRWFLAECQRLYIEGFWSQPFQKGGHATCSSTCHVSTGVVAPLGCRVLMIGGLSATATATPLTFALLMTDWSRWVGRCRHQVWSPMPRSTQQNAAGGVNGHKLVGTSSTRRPPGFRGYRGPRAIANGAIGILLLQHVVMDLDQDTPTTHGVPVTGFYADGKAGVRSHTTRHVRRRRWKRRSHRADQHPLRGLPSSTVPSGSRSTR